MKKQIVTLLFVVALGGVVTTPFGAASPQLPTQLWAFAGVAARPPPASAPAARKIAANSEAKRQDGACRRPFKAGPRARPPTGFGVKSVLTILRLRRFSAEFLRRTLM